MSSSTSKRPPRGKASLQDRAADRKTQQKLSSANCQNSFQNILRSGDPATGHVETKLCPYSIKVNRKHPNNINQVSHIFTGEDPATARPSGRAHAKYAPSNIMFNDDYFETNPKIKQVRKLRYEMERRHHEFENNQQLRASSAKKRPINKEKYFQNYLHNPMKVYSKNELDLYNKEIKEKNEKRAEAFYKTYGSDGARRTLGGVRRGFEGCEARGNNKITSNDFDINKKAIEINKNSESQKVPYYALRHPRHASCGSGKAMCYY